MKVLPNEPGPAVVPATGLLKRPTFFYLLLAGLTLAVFLPVRSFEFITFDDPDYVTKNSWVQRGLTGPGIQWAFQSFDAGNWHPVTWLSHMLDIELTGTGPGGPHRMNLLFHVANALLLLRLLWTLTGALWRSAMVAALFAWHPLHVESVAWVAERKDVLSAFFGLLCLLAYTQYAGDARSPIPGGEAESRPNPRRRGGYFLLALIFFILGLMSKPMLVTWPFIMLLLDYWPLRRPVDSRSAWRPLIWEKVPFFLLSLGECVITIIVQKRSGAIVPTSYLSIPARIANSLVGYVRYLAKAFWPTDLILPYPFPGHYWHFGLVAGCLILLAGVSVLVIRCRHRLRFAVVGWFWFLGMLVPVIGFLQVGGQSMADRYTYLPMVGIFIMVVWGVAAAVERWRLSRGVAGLAASVTLVACISLTNRQLSYWRNSETLFRHTLLVTPANGMAQILLAGYLSEANRAEEAIPHYLEGLRLLPDNFFAMNGIGVALTKTKQYPEAIDFLEAALQARPDLPEAHNNLGAVFAELGQLDAAIRHYQVVIQTAPENAVAHYRLGNALMKLGRIDDAIAEYSAAHLYQPANVDVLNNLGVAYLSRRKLDQAATQFNLVLRSQPGDVNAHFNLGNVFALQQKWPEASEHYLAALQVSPTNAAIHYGCGLAFARLGQREKAIEHLSEALRLNPGDAKARRELQTLQSASLLPSSPP